MSSISFRYSIDNIATLAWSGLHRGADAASTAAQTSRCVCGGPRVRDLQPMAAAESSAGQWGEAFHLGFCPNRRYPTARPEVSEHSYPADG